MKYIAILLIIVINSYAMFLKEPSIKKFTPRSKGEDPFELIEILKKKVQEEEDEITCKKLIQRRLAHLGVDIDLDSIGDSKWWSGFLEEEFYWFNACWLRDITLKESEMLWTKHKCFEELYEKKDITLKLVIEIFDKPEENDWERIRKLFYVGELGDNYLDNYEKNGDFPELEESAKQMEATDGDWYHKHAQKIASEKQKIDKETSKRRAEYNVAWFSIPSNDENKDE